MLSVGTVTLMVLSWGGGRGVEMALLPATSTGSTRSRDGNLDDFVYGYQEAAHDEKSSFSLSVSEK